MSFGGVRSLINISDITTLQQLKFLEFDICWKLQDFSPIKELIHLPQTIFYLEYGFERILVHKSKSNPS